MPATDYRSITTPTVLGFNETVQYQDSIVRLAVPTGVSGTVFRVDGYLSLENSRFDVPAWIQGYSGSNGQIFSIGPTGVVQVMAHGSSLGAIGYNGDTFSSPTFANYGTLTVTSDNWTAWGVITDALEGNIVNAGIIKVTGKEYSYGVVVHNLEYGYWFANYGTISVDTPRKTNHNIGVYLPISSNASFYNFGNISAKALTPEVESPYFSVGHPVGVHIERYTADRPGSEVYENRGTIEAEVSVYMDMRGGGLYEHNFSNASTGILRGSVRLSGLGAGLINAGLVEGDVVGLDGWQLYIAEGAGRVTGWIYGGAGNDTFYGGDVAERFNGNADDDYIYGGGGDDTAYGGQGHDRLQGDAGGDLLNGNIGNDTIHGGAGNDLIFGGQNDDFLYGDDGNDRLSGDLGKDTLDGGAGADQFVLRPGGGVDWVVGFNGSEGDRIAIPVGVAYTVTSASGQVMIDIGNGDQIGLAGVSPASFQTSWIVLI